MGELVTSKSLLKKIAKILDLNLNEKIFKKDEELTQFYQVKKRTEGTDRKEVKSYQNIAVKSIGLTHQVGGRVYS